MKREDLCALALGIGLAVSLICAAYAPRVAAWWGVVYRPLCQSATTSERAAETMARGVQTAEGFELRFKASELFENLQKRFSK